VAPRVSCGGARRCRGKPRPYMANVARRGGGLHVCGAAAAMQGARPLHTGLGASPAVPPRRRRWSCLARVEAHLGHTLSSRSPLVLSPSPRTLAQMPDARVTYRRRHSYNTRSNKIRKVKTPGERARPRATSMADGEPAASCVATATRTRVRSGAASRCHSAGLRPRGSASAALSSSLACGLAVPLTSLHLCPPTCVPSHARRPHLRALRHEERQGRQVRGLRHCAHRGAWEAAALRRGALRTGASDDRSSQRSSSLLAPMAGGSRHRWGVHGAESGGGAAPSPCGLESSQFVRLADAAR